MQNLALHVLRRQSDGDERRGYIQLSICPLVPLYQGGNDRRESCGGKGCWVSGQESSSLGDPLQIHANRWRFQLEGGEVKGEPPCVKGVEVR